MPSVLDILRPSVVTGIMNEVKTPFDRWQEFFGLGPKGANTVPSPVRTVGIDIVNDDRTVSQFTAPGGPADAIAPMVIGSRNVTAPRSFERMDLDFETLNNIRTIGEGASTLDQAGMSYLRQQAGHMVRRTRRFREFLIWGALRGSIQFLLSGQKWIPVTTGGTITLDWQMPADHKNQLGGIIGASWNTTTTPIVTDLAQICAQSEEDTGLPITHAWCNTSRWVKILGNDEVKALGGTANTPFRQWEAIFRQMAGTGNTGIGQTSNEMVGVLEGFPSITWHITDRVIKINGTVTKFLGDDEVIFHPEPDQDWIFGYEVKESTNQVTNAAPVDVYGYASWIKYPVDSDVPKYQLYSLDNFIPAINPNAVFFADVTP